MVWAYFQAASVPLPVILIGVAVKRHSNSGPWRAPPWRAEPRKGPVDDDSAHTLGKTTTIAITQKRNFMLIFVGVTLRRETQRIKKPNGCNEKEKIGEPSPVRS